MGNLHKGKIQLYMLLNAIIQELPKLTPDERNTLKAHLDFLNKNGTLGITVTLIKPKKSTIKGLLHICISKYVTVLDIAIIEGVHDKQYWNDRLESTALAIETIAKDLSLDRKGIMRLCQIVVEAAVCKIQEKKEPLSFKTVMNFMSEPRSLLDESFPGYLNTPLFKIIVLGSINERKNYLHA